MKKYLILLVMLPIMFSCTQKKETEKLQARVDSLKNVISGRDSTDKGFVSSLNEIEENLSNIREKEHIINVDVADKNGELKTSAKDKINAEITEIYNLLKKNKRLVYHLNKKMKTSNALIEKFKKMFNDLNAELIEKDKEINSLKEQLAKLHIDVANLSSQIDTLKSENESQKQEIAKQQTELNTAYFIIGTKSELFDKKVTTKEGGFIGLGRVQELRSTANLGAFTQIDVTQTNFIPINMKKVKILSTQPEGTYKLEEGDGMVKDILITKPAEFWKVSKYLVIEVK